MTIKPVVKTVTVKASPERAFEAFTANMGQWWPRGHTIGAAPFEAVVMEPRVGGRWYERAADGAQTNWGQVLAWEPPRRFVLAWQISADWAYDPNLMTEVEVTFEPQDGGTTAVTLEHRRLELFGERAQAMADQFDGGWVGVIQHFVDFVGA
ncbi:MAG TPA: SRPBCC family protein [Caulobacteraceae bacterium]|nr:SRPBCC family protein [Caulobacteraceae bacterium]